MTILTRSEWTAIIGLAHRLESTDLVAKVHIDCLFANVPHPSVVVVGVVNRGKSTLINDLLGMRVSPQSVTPETASLLAFVNMPGRPCTGFTVDGSVERLSNSPNAFARRVQRGSGRELPTAVFTAAHRLPVGMSLIDTPGVMEAASGADPSLLVNSTREAIANADAAVVVFGVPGVKATDVQLYKDCLSRFGRSRTLLVLKGNDSSVSMEDLEMWREELQVPGDRHVAMLCDLDRSQMSVVDGFLKTVPGMFFPPSAIAKSTLDAIVAKLGEYPELGVPGRVCRDLPTQIAEMVRERDPRRVRRAVRHQAKEQARRSKEEFKARLAAWKHSVALANSAMFRAKKDVEAAAEHLKNLERWYGSFGAGVARFWHGEARADQQRLVVEQARTKLALAIDVHANAERTYRDLQWRRPERPGR